jgi:uncharacterized protein YmfQ (DUF2313 family)
MATSEDYKSQLLKLQPLGFAWSTEKKSNWVKLLSALAEELGRVDARSQNLVDEIIPHTTSEAITDWERVAGIPDLCLQLRATLAIRRADLVAKLSARGGASPQYFIDVAASLGYTITITEFDAFRVGRDVTGSPLNGEGWEYNWRVNSALNTVTYFRASQNSAGDRLAEWGNERLECIITARKPAHTVLFFGYS